MISRASPVWQLYRSYRRSEGERLVQRLRELERPHRLLRTNVAALHEALPQNRAGGVALPLADVPLGSTEKRILGEFERAVHGLLASTATLETSIGAVATSAPRSRALSRWYETERGRRVNEAAGLAFADQRRNAVLATGRIP